MSLVLSLFPGLGLLDRAFEEAGYCVVRGPDLLWGGDIHRFHPPAAVFDGVIGGPPCKPFSPIARIHRHRGREPRHPNLIPEFERCVREVQPKWFLMENVEWAPLPGVDGYITQSLILNNRWLGEEQNRRRRFSFGTRDGRTLDVSPDVVIFEDAHYEPAVTGHGGGIAGLAYDRNGVSRPKSTFEATIAAAKRPLSRLLELQGLPTDLLDDAPFTSNAKRDVVGNGVPLPMGRAIARAITRAMSGGGQDE